MAYENNAVLEHTNDESIQDMHKLTKQLSDAKKEIDELKMQLMWMERSYE